MAHNIQTHPYPAENNSSDEGKIGFNEKNERDECSMYLPHAQCILGFHKFSGDFEGSLLDLLFKLGQYFVQKAKYIESEQSYRQSLELRENSVRQVVSR